jgi:hypothetical protein
MIGMSVVRYLASGEQFGTSSLRPYSERALLVGDEAREAQVRSAACPAGRMKQFFFLPARVSIVIYNLTECFGRTNPTQNATAFSHECT